MTKEEFLKSFAGQNKFGGTFRYYLITELENGSNKLYLKGTDIKSFDHLYEKVKDKYELDATGINPRFTLILEETDV
jgi:hypothetical protein